VAGAAAGAVAGGGAGGAAAAPAPAVEDGTTSDSDDDDRELNYVEDRTELQRLIGQEMEHARKREDVQQLLAFTAIARYHDFITDPDNRESAAPSPGPQAARPACATSCVLCPPASRVNQRCAPAPPATARDRIAASRAVAEVLYYKPSNRKKNRETTFKYRAEKIRADLKYFAVHRTLPDDKRGCGTSNPSRIHDVDFQGRCRRVISGLAKLHENSEWSARDFRSAIMKDMREDGTLPEGRGISTKTICFFLRYLDMELVEPKKGIYKDGTAPLRPPLSPLSRRPLMH